MTDHNSNPERFSLKAVFAAIVDSFDVNKGFIKTFRLLTSAPGESIRTYLKGDRKIMTQPIKLLLVSTAVVAFLTFHVLPIDQVFSLEKSQTEQLDRQVEQYKAKGMSEEEVTKLIETQTEFNKKYTDFFSNYYNLIILLSIPFMALFTFLFFKKSGYNYAENIILNAYSASYINFLFLVLAPIIYFFPKFGFALSMAISYVYYVYCFHRFFERRLVSSLFRSIAAIIFGTVSYMIFTMILLTAAIFIMMPK